MVGIAGVQPVPTDFDRPLTAVAAARRLGIDVAQLPMMVLDGRLRGGPDGDLELTVDEDSVCPTEAPPIQRQAVPSARSTASPRASSLLELSVVGIDTAPGAPPPGRVHPTSTITSTNAATTYRVMSV